MDADILHKTPVANALIWDCGSSLYDSVELKSFRIQLDAALASRCFSMTTLTSNPQRLHPPPPPAAAAASGTQMITRRSLLCRFSRSVQKLTRSLLRLKPAPGRQRPTDQHVLYGSCSDTGVVLASIPEVCEKDLGSPDQQCYSMGIGKAASERFVATRAAASVSLRVIM